MLKAYLVGRVGNVVPTVRIYGWRRLIAFEEQLLGVFVSGSEEPFQSLVLLRTEFP